MYYYSNDEKAERAGGDHIVCSFGVDTITTPESQPLQHWVDMEHTIQVNQQRSTNSAPQTTRRCNGYMYIKNHSHGITLLEKRQRPTHNDNVYTTSFRVIDLAEKSNAPPTMTGIPQPHQCHPIDKKMEQNTPIRYKCSQVCLY